MLEEQSSKRKSSENAEEDEPPAKRKSSESVEKTALLKNCRIENERKTKANAPQVSYKFSFSHIDVCDSCCSPTHVSHLFGIVFLCLLFFSPFTLSRIRNLC